MKKILLRTSYYFLNIIRNRRFLILFAIFLVLIVNLYSREWYDKLDLAHKFSYWFLLIGGASVISIFFYAITRSLFYEKRISPYLNIFLSTLFSIAASAFYARILMHVFIPEQGWLTFGQLLIYSLCIVGTACIVVFLSVPFPKTVDAQAAMRTPPIENVLISRLPFYKRGPVISVEMNDHYAKVTTTNGTEMLHIRMSKVVEQLQDHNGIQIHRSFWVNKKFIKEVRRDGRKYIVRMSNGSEFPMSETFVKVAREADII